MAKKQKFVCDQNEQTRKRTISLKCGKIYSGRKNVVNKLFLLHVKKCLRCAGNDEYIYGGEHKVQIGKQSVAQTYKLVDEVKKEMNID